MTAIRFLGCTEISGFVVFFLERGVAFLVSRLGVELKTGFFCNWSDQLNSTKTLASSNTIEKQRGIQMIWHPVVLSLNTGY